MPIEPLKRILLEEDEDGTQKTRLPNNKEMMDKINEIIYVLNLTEQNTTKVAAALNKHVFETRPRPKIPQFNSRTTY